MEYTHALLDRLFVNLAKYNAQMNEGKKSGFILPTIEKQHTKTIVHNFEKVCKAMNRAPEHVKNFIEKQLNVKSSVTGTGALLLVKAYPPKDIEKLFTQQYVQTYVRCACKSFKTSLIKENKITYMVCDGCKSKNAIDCGNGNGGVKF